MPKKLKKGPLGFFIIHSVAKLQKNKGGHFGGKKFEKKLHSAEKTERGDLLVSPVFVCYAGKKGKTFLVQFTGPPGTI